MDVGSLKVQSGIMLLTQAIVRITLVLGPEQQLNRWFPISAITILITFLLLQYAIIAEGGPRAPVSLSGVLRAAGVLHYVG